MTRRIVTWEEQDAYTRWRKVLSWHPGERKDIKRRTHQRERREARGEVFATLDELLPPVILPFTDKSDCRHGCNGDCEEWGGEGQCDFTCHDYRCESCTAPATLWLDGWFCSHECTGRSQP